MSLLVNRVINISLKEVKLPAPKERELQPKIKFNLIDHNESLQIIKTIRTNRERIRGLRSKKTKINLSTLREEINRADARIKTIRGYISWENNRSKQASTIIKRGF